MQTNIKELDGLKREIEITLTLEELQPHFEKALIEAQKDAQLDGFRKGKVPMNIIKARFGKALERDALGDIANESFQEAIKANELDVAGYPSLNDMKRTEDGGAFFAIQYEVYPTLELKEYHEVEVQKPLRPITEEDVDSEVKRLLLGYAALEPAEQVVDTMHVVKAKFSEMDKETGMPLLGGKDQELFLENPEMDVILRNDLMNLKVGDSFTYTQEHAAGEHGEHAHTHTFHVTVNEINKVVPPELSNEFVERITQNQLHTTEELRDDLRKQMEAQWNREVEEAMRNQLISKFIEIHPMDVPSTLVAITAQDMVEGAKKENENNPAFKRAKNEDLFKMYLPVADQTVRWQMISGEIVKKENLEVGEEDFSKLAEGLGIDVEQVKLAVQNNDQIRGRMMADRLFSFLFERVTVTEVSYDEFGMANANEDSAE